MYTKLERLTGGPAREREVPLRCARCGHHINAHDEGSCAVNHHETATGPECECEEFVMPEGADELSEDGVSSGNCEVHELQRLAVAPLRQPRDPP